MAQRRKKTAKKTAKRTPKTMTALRGAQKKLLADLRKRQQAARKRQMTLQAQARARLKKAQTEEMAALRRAQQLELKARREAEKREKARKRETERLKKAASKAKAKPRRKAKTKRGVGKRLAEGRFSGIKVMLAYYQLAAQHKSPHVVISELAEKARVPVAPLKRWLLKEARAGRADFALGEPTLATKEQRKAAIRIEGRPHLYVELIKAPSSKKGTRR